MAENNVKDMMGSLNNHRHKFKEIMIDNLDKALLLAVKKKEGKEGYEQLDKILQDFRNKTKHIKELPEFDLSKFKSSVTNADEKTIARAQTDAAKEKRYDRNVAEDAVKLFQTKDKKWIKKLLEDLGDDVRLTENDLDTEVRLILRRPADHSKELITLAKSVDKKDSDAIITGNIAKLRRENNPVWIFGDHVPRIYKYLYLRTLLSALDKTKNSKYIIRPMDARTLQMYLNALSGTKYYDEIKAINENVFNAESVLEKK